MAYSRNDAGKKKATRSAAAGDAHTPAAAYQAYEELAFQDHHEALAVCGPGEVLLRLVAEHVGVTAGLRGQVLRVQGEPDQVRNAVRAVSQLRDLVAAGTELTDREVRLHLRTLQAHPEVELRDVVNDVLIITAQRKTIAPKGVAQQRYLKQITEHDLVFGIGPAGTGKTYLAMAMAVKALQDKRVKRIILTRPAVEAGEKLGFLPGDLAEKVNPYLRPLYDALHDMMDLDKAQALLDRGVIEVAPLAFMRGRTLNDSFVILDEAQNTTPEQMKMFLTRLGYDSKAVVTGDVTQVDLPEGKPSGLRDAEQLLFGIKGVAIQYFTDADVVRHPLVQRILKAYEARENARAAATAPTGTAPVAPGRPS
jgi:phosphate starvation-inducible PhoH-like protein